MHEHRCLACRALRRPAVPSAVPAAIYAASVLLGERVGVGEDEDRIDADAEDEVEGDEGEDGRLVGSE